MGAGVPAAVVIRRTSRLVAGKNSDPGEDEPYPY